MNQYGNPGPFRPRNPGNGGGGFRIPHAPAHRMAASVPAPNGPRAPANPRPLEIWCESPIYLGQEHDEMLWLKKATTRFLLYYYTEEGHIASKIELLRRMSEGRDVAQIARGLDQPHLISYLQFDPTSGSTDDETKSEGAKSGANGEKRRREDEGGPGTDAGVVAKLPRMSPEWRDPMERWRD